MADKYREALCNGPGRRSSSAAQPTWKPICWRKVADDIAPYYFTGVRVELEGIPYLAAIGIDLTESKQAEAAVRRSESELRSFVEHAPYGIGDDQRAARQVSCARIPRW